MLPHQVAVLSTGVCPQKRARRTASRRPNHRTRTQMAGSCSSCRRALNLQRPATPDRECGLVIGGRDSITARPGSATCASLICLMHVTTR